MNHFDCTWVDTCELYRFCHSDFRYSVLLEGGVRSSELKGKNKMLSESEN